MSEGQETYIIEVYLGSPGDVNLERQITEAAARHGGRLDYRYDAASQIDSPARFVELTYEFDEVRAAQAAMDDLNRLGHYVEGPSRYS